MYFLSGWTVLIYMSFPVVRILIGAQSDVWPALCGGGSGEDAAGRQPEEPRALAASREIR